MARSIRKATIKRSGKHFYYTLSGDNGEVLVMSEVIKNRGDIYTVLNKYFPDFPISDLTDAKKDK